MMVLTWTTLSDVSRDGSVSSSDDNFIVYTFHFYHYFCYRDVEGNRLFTEIKNWMLFISFSVSSCVVKVTGRVAFVQQNNTTSWI